MNELSPAYRVCYISFAATDGEQLAGTGDSTLPQQASTTQDTVLPGAQDNPFDHGAAVDSAAASLEDGLTTSPAAEILRSRSTGRKLMSDFGVRFSLGQLGSP